MIPIDSPSLNWSEEISRGSLHDRYGEDRKSGSSMRMQENVGCDYDFDWFGGDGANGLKVLVTGLHRVEY